MSVAYRERDRDRYDDTRSTVSSRQRGDVKVTRYVVREDDNRSSYGGRDRQDDARSAYTGRPDRYDRSTDRVEETRIIRTEREEEPARDYRREEPAGYSREEIIIRRDESPRREDSRKSDYYRRPTETTEDRELIIRRTSERESDSRENLTVSRYDDRRDSRYQDYGMVRSPRASFDDRDRDLQRYVRTAEYYSPPAQQPQTIIIRQEPIIIRERAREEDYQLVRKSEVDEERSVVRREPSREPPREEEYFYEKKVRERIPEDERSERRLTRREVSPGDSISQVGRRDRGYESDDSMVYVRKETREEYDSGGDSPHRKRDLAAGVIAGVGAAELLRNHKKKEGKDTSHGVGRIGRDLGAGALGAVAAEGIRRYRSRSRRRRSSSGEREYERGDRRDRSRSRRRDRSSSSEGHGKLKTFGTVGLAAAALAAGAAIAQRKMSKKDESPNRGRHGSRSRSRKRRDSRSHSLSSLENDPTADDARNPMHRNARIAGAGAVGAAAAALIERARSRSRARNGERERSKSRIRQGIPIAATALGSAALAGLYEKNKAKREAETIQKEERKARSRSRSRARSNAYHDGPPQSTFSDPNLIEYGNGPMYGNNFGADYYGRPASVPQENYYNNATRDVVPATVPVGADLGAREARTRSLSSEDGRRSHSRRRRSRSRDHAAAEAAAAGAGAAAVAESERRREKKERKRRERERSYGSDPYHGRDPYEDANYSAQAAGYTATPPPVDPYATHTGFGYQSQFPPPPGSVPQPAYAPQMHQAAPQPAAAYGPQDFPPPPAQPPPGAPAYDPYAANQNPYAPRPRGADENVSAENPSSAPTDQHLAADGVETQRAVTPPPLQRSPTPNSGSAKSSMPNLTVPSTHNIVPPNEETREFRPPTPQIPPKAETPPNDKRVSFAPKPDINTLSPATTRDESEASSPDIRRQRRRHGEERRGYEAGDDFSDDTPLEDHRRRNYHDNSRSNRGVEHDHNQDRERDRDHDRRQDRDRDRDRDRRRRRERDPRSFDDEDRRDRGKSRRENDGDSDDTEELPPRFDDQGRKRPEGSNDPLADKIDEILAGKGTAGKAFGNIVGGLFGPDGQKKKR